MLKEVPFISGTGTEQGKKRQTRRIVLPEYLQQAEERHGWIKGIQLTESLCGTLAGGGRLLAKDILRENGGPTL